MHPDTLKAVPQFLFNSGSALSYDQLFILFQKIIVTLLMGLVIGIEREYSKHKNEPLFAGVRTFPLIAVAGLLAGLLYTLLGVAGFVIVAFSILGLVLLSYYRSSADGHIGITSEIAAAISFFVGTLVYFDFLLVAAIITIFTTLLLSLKLQLHTMVDMISSDDIAAALKLSIISIIILPLLPGISFGPQNAVNLRSIWLFIIFIGAISFIGYLLLKFIGLNKGILLTALFGGVVSSTALTYSFSKKSKENEVLSARFGSGMVLASSMVFPKVWIIVSVINPVLAQALIIPLAVLFIIALSIGGYSNKKSNSGETVSVEMNNPFELKSALLFGVIFGVILLSTAYAQLWFGERGAYITAGLAGLTNIDAITITMAQLTKSGVALRTGYVGILIAIFVNTCSKYTIVRLYGSAAMEKNIRTGVASILILLIVSIIFGFIFL